jgi:acetyl-CoA carboxylase carboxyltransferase component
MRPAEEPLGDHDDELSGWKPLLDELARRQSRAREMGGAERLERLVYSRGKLDARQRLERLFDPGSFTEIGALVGGTEVPADACVAGGGQIEGRPAFACAEDFSVLGGSIGAGNMAKRYRVCQLAEQEQAPLVMMLEGAGHRLTSNLEGHSRAPNDLLALADLSGQVPMVCLVLGASAGHGALASPLSDFTVMTEAPRKSLAVQSSAPRSPAPPTTWSPTMKRRSRWHAGTSGTSPRTAWAHLRGARARMRRLDGPTNCWP